MCATFSASLPLVCGPKPWLKRIGKPYCMVSGATKSVSKNLHKGSLSRSLGSME